MALGPERVAVDFVGPALPTDVTVLSDAAGEWEELILPEALARNSSITVPAAVVPSLPPMWVPQPFSTSSIFRQDATTLPRASQAEIEAHNYPQLFANQMLYTIAAQTGKFFGYGGVGKGGSAGEGNQVAANWKSFTPAVYIVPPNQPRVKVWLVKSNVSEEVRSKAEDPTNLQAQWLSVPMPTAALIPNNEQVWPEGNDKEVIVWCPATGEYWEFWGLSKFLAGEHAGEYKAGFGGAIPNIWQSSGVLPNNWGARASGLAAAGGSITHADLVRVLRGGKIGHALGVALVCTKGPANGAHLAPATRNDAHENTAGTAETNPAFGTVDGCPEGLRLAQPKELTATAAGFVRATEPIAYEVHEAMREHGVIVDDTSITSAAFYISDARVLPTPYADTIYNPFAGWEGAEPKPATVNTEVNSHIPASMTDPTLPPIKENLLNTKSIFAKQSWRTLEQLAPSAS